VGRAHFVLEEAVPAWKKQIEILKAALQNTTAETNLCASWGILFEYPMFRLAASS